MTEAPKIPFQMIRSILAAAGISPVSVTTIEIDATSVTIGQLLDSSGVPALKMEDIHTDQNGMLREMKTTFDIDFRSAAAAIVHDEARMEAFRGKAV